MLSNQIVQKRPGFIRRIRNKIRYGLFVGEVLDWVSKSGITIFPYYMVREGLSSNSMPPKLDEEHQSEVGFLGSEDMAIIAAMRGKGEGKDTFLQYLAAGKKCIGVKYQGEIVGFTWCDLSECFFGINRVPLKEDEAYLFGAFTSKTFRGRGLAPYMRYQCYKELAKLGKKRLYSVTAYFNTSSIKFKMKLGAQPVNLNLYIRLFKKWDMRLRLKNYDWMA